MDHLELILPSFLLITAFGYKLVVDQRVTIVDFVERFIDMPVEVVFLGGSFLVSYILSDPAHHELGLLCFFVGLIISVIVYIFSKRAREAFLKERYKTCIGFASASFLPAVITFIFCIRLVIS